MAQDDYGQQWAKELVARVGLAIKTARGKRSAAWLSDRTAELGYRVSPTVIAKLDSGHRGEVLSVAEWLILSAALDVTPMALLFPDIPDGPVDMLPGVQRTSFVAAAWVAGDDIDGLAARPEALSALDVRHYEVMKLAKQRAHTERHLTELKNMLSTLDSDDEVDKLAGSMVRTQQQLQSLNERIRSAGGVVSEDD
ncbi:MULTISPECIES: hypothetical protein [unclassified Mycolicibacterium]|uniref:hypothetical protein n=1 Tax=unclassified Mycolicibacterium TaxID=2636767 RepID=UPI001FD5BEB6|nr:MULTISPECIES: hypothetical protein [unclassified Mycolicibacterium]